MNGLRNCVMTESLCHPLFLPFKVPGFDPPTCEGECIINQRKSERASPRDGWTMLGRPPPPTTGTKTKQGTTISREKGKNHSCCFTSILLWIYDTRTTAHYYYYYQLPNEVDVSPVPVKWWLDAEDLFGLVVLGVLPEDDPNQVLLPVNPALALSESALVGLAHHVSGEGLLSPLQAAGRGPAKVLSASRGEETGADGQSVGSVAGGGRDWVGNRCRCCCVRWKTFAPWTGGRRW